MQDKPHIIIVGAGLAGLAAAKALLGRCHLTLLEARNRIGGRTHTDYSLGVPFDLGAFLIHGINDNPMTALAKKTHTKIGAADRFSLFLAKEQSQLDKTQLLAIDAQFQQLLQAANTYAKHAKQDLSLADALAKVFSIDQYHLLTKEIYNLKTLFLSFYTGMETQYLSAKFWNEDEIILSGGNYFMLDGYQPIVNFLAQDISNIILNSVVTDIHYDEQGVTIKTQQQTYQGDAVIVTVPLGVLQSGRIHFAPSLPAAKERAINHLGMGLLNKLALKFPKVFWPNDYRLLTALQSEYHSFSCFINYANLMKKPVLVGTVAGVMAQKMEKLSDERLVEEAMRTLRAFFGPHIPYPTAVLVTRFQADNYAQGSYSYLPVGATCEDYDILAQPVADKVFFAGEATHRNFFATTHGAYLSGIREANRIVNIFFGE